MAGTNELLWEQLTPNPAYEPVQVQLGDCYASLTPTSPRKYNGVQAATDKDGIPIYHCLQRASE